MTSFSFPELRFQVSTPEALQADAAWWAIYPSTTTYADREQPEVLFRSMTEGTGIAVCAKDGEKTVGMAFVHLLQHPAAVFLGVVAVGVPESGYHLSGMLLEYAWQAGAAAMRANGKEPMGYVWEAELASLGTTDAARREREQLMHFYERHGAVGLAHPYLLPALRGSGNTPMELMFRPLSDAPLPTVEESEALVRGIYFEKYGPLNEIATAALEALIKA